MREIEIAHGRRLLVRGVEKAVVVRLWHALTHNMARLWTLEPA